MVHVLQHNLIFYVEMAHDSFSMVQLKIIIPLQKRWLIAE